MYKTEGSWFCLFHPGNLLDLMGNGYDSNFSLDQTNSPQIPTSVTSAVLKIRDSSINESKAVNYPDTYFISLLFIILGNISEDT